MGTVGYIGLRIDFAKGGTLRNDSTYSFTSLKNLLSQINDSSECEATCYGPNECPKDAIEKWDSEFTHVIEIAGPDREYIEAIVENQIMDAPGVMGVSDIFFVDRDKKEQYDARDPGEGFEGSSSKLLEIRKKLRDFDTNS